MPFDREETLKKGENLRRQGRLDAAIAEYVRVLEDEPRDWTAANTLGELYLQVGQPERALAQYGRIADHFRLAGFYSRAAALYSRAAALYKKLLKLVPDDERVQLLLFAKVSQHQGLLADARAYLSAVADCRRARADAAGAAEIVVRQAAADAFPDLPKRIDRLTRVDTGG